MGPFLKQLGALAFLIAWTVPASASETIPYYEQQLQNAVFTAIFYASSIALLAIFALFNVATRNYYGLWYTAQFAIGLFFVACIDGTASKVLWPNNPEFTNWIPLTALLTLNGNGLMLAVATSKAEPTALMKRLSGFFEAMGLLSFICIALIPVVPIILLATIANILFLPMIAAQVISVRSWSASTELGAERENDYAQRFSRITGLLFAFSTILIACVAWYQISKDTFSYAQFSVVAVRLVYLLLSLSLVATYLAHIIGIRQDRQVALKNELRSARRAARASNEKLESERQFARMKELALKRRQKLASASHDIRQPLVSLGLTLDKLRHSSDRVDELEYQSALEYIAQLADSFSSQESEPEHSEAEVARLSAEVMPMNLLLQTVTQMFHNEAAEKGVRLSTVPTEMSALVNPVAVMRIVSNLVANAIEHSGSDRIVIGCRRSDADLCIEVWDAGVALNQQQFEEFKQREQKGVGSSGQGIGLANCAELALQHRYTFALKDGGWSGNCFFLRVPRHREG